MTPDQKAAVERLRRWLNESDCKYAGDLETALAHIAQLERDLEELVKAANDLSKACMWRGLFADKLSALRAALRRHEEP